MYKVAIGIKGGNVDLGGEKSMTTEITRKAKGYSLFFLLTARASVSEEVVHECRFPPSSVSHVNTVTGPATGCL